MLATRITRFAKPPSNFSKRWVSQSAAKKVVIIGGVAGGATAAARLRRLSEKCHITLIEQGKYVSFANCGLPYHVSGEIKDRNKLLLQTPESLKETLDIQKILTETQAINIDRVNKKVKVMDVKTRSVSDIAYDNLILSMGASPISPSSLPGAQQGIDQGKIVTLRTIPDMDHINEMIAQGAKSAVIVGAGYIGLEMVEALVARGLQVTLVEKQNHILPIMDEEMTWQILAELHAKGVTVKSGEGVQAFESLSGKLGVKLTLESGSSLLGDFVLCCTGVNPDTKIATEAGLATNTRGAVVVNDYQQTSDKAVYAVGDCVETADPILGQRVWVPLGGPANRQGRVAADHIVLGSEAQKYPGTLGTAIVRVFDCAAGVTGYTETKLTKMGLKLNQDFLTTTVSATQHAGYFPGALPLSLKIIWRKSDGKLLGAQAVGMEGVDKRMDVMSMALRAGMSVDDLVHSELSYAPPFGSAKDIINLAAFSAQNMQKGLLTPSYSLPKNKSEGVTLDVRPTEVAQIHSIPNSVNIPFNQIRQRVGELESLKNSPITTICGTGKTSYFAARTLTDNGFNARSFVGGAAALEAPAAPAPSEAAHTQQASAAPMEEHHLDACGLSCPGPIIAIRKCMDTMPEGRVVKVTATDPGFANDLPAFCKMTGISMLGLTRDKGTITARIVKGAPPAASTSSAPAKATEASVADGRRGTSIIVFSQEWDKVLAAFVLATGSAATGAPVTMFFTFWGLNVLRKAHKTSSTSSNPPEEHKAGATEKAFLHMMPKGPSHLPLSHFNMGGIGQWMFKKVMHEKHLPDVEGLMKEAKSLGVRMVACNMSMDALGLSRSDIIDECELGGVADFLAASQKSATSLFI